MIDSTLSLLAFASPLGWALGQTFAPAVGPVAISPMPMPMPMVGECSRFFAEEEGRAANVRLDITTGVACCLEHPKKEAAPSERNGVRAVVACRTAMRAEVVRGNEATITMDGALDASTVHALQPTLDAAAADEPHRLTLDFARLTLIDTAGVRAIVSILKRVKSNGGEVVIVGACEQPLTVLKLLKLDGAFGLA
jgi:anti-sigma B factor antagonist